jgi:hypothetical protein
VVERKKVRETGRIRDLIAARTIEPIDDLMKKMATMGYTTRMISMNGVKAMAHLPVEIKNDFFALLLAKSRN